MMVDINVALPRSLVRGMARYVLASNYRSQSGTQPFSGFDCMGCGETRDRPDMGVLCTSCKLLLQQFLLATSEGTHDRRAEE